MGVWVAAHGDERRKAALFCVEQAVTVLLTVLRYMFFVLNFFCSLALIAHKTEKVLKCKWTTNQYKHLGSQAKQTVTVERRISIFTARNVIVTFKGRGVGFSYDVSKRKLRGKYR